MDQAGDEIREALEAYVAAGEIRADGVWYRVREHFLPEDQRSGWKLHIALLPATYTASLKRILPVLAEAAVAFKVLRSVADVEAMLDGRYGLAQVGKCVAIYPPDEETAAKLAEQLASVLRGERGVTIPTDARYRDDAPVFFRFGPYDNRYLVDPLGQARRVLAHPDHGDVVDATSGGETAAPLPQVLPVRPEHDHLAWLREEYLPVKLLQLSAKGGTFLALSIRSTPPMPVLLKTARAGAQADLSGRDALWGLAHEHAMLKRLEGAGGIPPAGQLLQDGDDCAVLVRPFVEGETWWEWWTQSASRSASARAAMAAVLRKVAERVAAVHAQGIVLRDLSPGNIVLHNEEPFFVDLELAHVLSDESPGYRRGTAGFYDPARDRFAAPEVGDDHYALLSLAFMSHTGLHPALVSGPQGGWCGPGAPVAPSFAAAWSAAVAARGGDAFGALYEGLLACVGDWWAKAHPTVGSGEIVEAAEVVVSRALADPANPEVFNYYDGVAGLVAALAEWGESTAFDLDEVWPAPALEAAEALVHVPGLYFGAPGIALAAVLDGRRRGDSDLLARGVDLLQRCVAQAGDVPDLCQGLAGLALAASRAAHAASRDDLHLLARDAGLRLVGLAESEGDGLIWPWPEGAYGTMAGARLYGYAHGVAGIVDVLLRLWEDYGDAQLRDAALGGLATLHAVARPLEGDACWWPPDAEEDTCWNAWCHGTPGVVKALATAVRVLERAEDRALLERGVRGIGVANNGGFCLCHGIASRLDAYCDALEVLKAAAREQVAEAAARDAALLARLEVSAMRMGASGEPGFGLMTGPLGVAWVLRRYRALEAAE